MFVVPVRAGLVVAVFGEELVADGEGLLFVGFDSGGEFAG